MFPRVIQFLSGRNLARSASRSISALLQCTVLATIAVSMFAGVNISVGESVQGGVVAQIEVGGGEVWAEVWDRSAGAASSNSQYTGTTTPTAQSDKDDIWKSFLSLLNGITNIFFALLTPLLMLAGWLLTPDWVFGEIFGLRPILHDLWVLVSNVVYVIFAFLLVVMAFMNIFAGEKNTWAIKAKLPKLIVGVISVPFTWFFVSAVVSISSVLTASAIQLAGDLVPTDAQATFMAPKECTINFKATPKGTDMGVGADGSFSSCTKSEPRKLSDFLKSKDAYGIVSYYAYGVFQVQDLKKITGANLETAKTLLDLGVGVLMALIIFIIFLLIIIALVIAMMMRAFYFWAIAVFSPLLSLRYFFDGKLGFGDDWLSVGKIIGLAMVPVYVAAALSLGLVFISAASSTNLTVRESSYVTDVNMTAEKQELTVLGTKFTVLGTPVGANTAADIQTLGGGFIGGLLIKIAALCILWFAVMAALKGSKITQEAAEPISKFGGEIGGLLKKLPQYAPIIPTGHGKASISSLSRISSTVSAGVDAKYGSGRGSEIGGKIADALNLNTGASKKTEEALQYINQQPPSSNPIEQADRFKKMTSVGGLDQKAYAIPRNREILSKYVDKIGNASLEEKKELQDLVGKLNGQEEPFRVFLTKLKGVTRDHTIDEVDEVNKIAKEGVQSATSNASTAGAAPKGNINFNINGTPATFNLNLTGNDPSKQKVGDTSAELTTKLASLKTSLSGLNDVATKASRDKLIESLEGANVKDTAEINKILTALDLKTI